jgi:hypothetical protein
MAPPTRLLPWHDTTSTTASPDLGHRVRLPPLSTPSLPPSTILTPVAATKPNPYPPASYPGFLLMSPEPFGGDCRTSIFFVRLGICFWIPIFHLTLFTDILRGMCHKMSPVNNPTLMLQLKGNRSKEWRAVLHLQGVVVRVAHARFSFYILTFLNYILRNELDQFFSKSDIFLVTRLIKQSCHIH